MAANAQFHAATVAKVLRAHPLFDRDQHAGVPRVEVCEAVGFHRTRL